MTDITDLDVLVPQTKTVLFGGQSYTLPGDMPMEIFLKVNLAGQAKDADGNVDQVKQLDLLIDTISDLFTFEQYDDAGSPRIDQLQIDAIRTHVGTTIRRRGVGFALKLMSTIYKADEVEESAEGNVVEGQAQEVEGSNGTTSSSTLPSPANPNVIPAEAASSA